MTNTLETPSTKDIEEASSCCSSSSCCAPQTPVTREAPKIGRNDPCACGSCVKFKKCCGKN